MISVFLLRLRTHPPTLTKQCIKYFIGKLWLRCDFGETVARSPLSLRVVPSVDGISKHACAASVHESPSFSKIAFLKRAANSGSTPAPSAAST